MHRTIELAVRVSSLSRRLLIKTACDKKCKGTEWKGIHFLASCFGKKKSKIIRCMYSAIWKDPGILKASWCSKNDKVPETQELVDIIMTSLPCWNLQFTSLLTALAGTPPPRTEVYAASSSTRGRLNRSRRETVRLYYRNRKTQDANFLRSRWISDNGMGLVTTHLRAMLGPSKALRPLPSANLAHPLTLYFLLFTEGPHVVQAGLTLLSLPALPPKCQDAGGWHHCLVFNRSLGMPESSLPMKDISSPIFSFYVETGSYCVAKAQ